ncbi:DMT family transporter [Homoserinibacter sp. YIM 151385]|uniref:DMT family transporter n=1 Tax=Homoserinibacter sp. YIM 151385 TaxID=2985506 RepID=UPI0022F09E9B|nr:DMT family transporter [Homoserinibacter sp. YIM 151385]WBU39011.1 DMT family transporter [Homoserinibacter sp. YIM 151385]
MTSRPRVGVAIACLVAATLFWAVNYVVGAGVLGEIDPVSLTLLRWLIAVAPLVLLARAIERPDSRTVLRRWPALLGLAALGMLGYNLALYFALQFTTPVSASLINALNPALIALVAALLLRQRLRPRTLAGLGIGLVGVLLVVTKGELAAVLGRSLNPGDLLMLLAIAVWTAYTILGRRLQDVPPITATAAQAVLTIGLAAPLALFGGFRLPATAEGMWAVAVIGVLPSVGSYLLWNTALRTIPAATAGVALNLITVFTVAISLALGARVGPGEVLGGVLVLGGVALASWPAGGRSGAAGEPRPASAAEE